MDGAGRIKDKVKARLVGGGDCQERSKYSEAEASSLEGSTVSISLIAQIADYETHDYHLRNRHQIFVGEE